MTLAWLLIALTSAFLAAFCFFPALELERQKRAVVLWGLAVPIAFSPLWIPLEEPFLRLLAAMTAIALLAKLYDLHVSASRALHPYFSTFVDIAHLTAKEIT